MTINNHVLNRPWPLSLLLVVIPLGVAGQNIGAALAGLAMMFALARQIRQFGMHSVWARTNDVRPLLYFSMIFLTILTLASFLNRDLPVREFNFIGGYGFWVCAPWLVSACFGMTMSRQNPVPTIKVLVVLAVVLALICTSQVLMGWKIVGGSFVPAEPRARGFYSHPLSLAYAALLWLPFALIAALRRINSRQAWLSLVAIFVILITSGSRTVLAVSVILVGWNIFIHLRGRHRGIAVLLLIFGLTTLLVTENSLSRRIKATFKGQEDRQSAYVDDRLAFWDVHWSMFKEKPIIGHGDATITAYRIPYYEKLGLADFQKKYEAHNLYLQVAVNTGIAGLLAFLGWFLWLIAKAAYLRKAADHGVAYLGESSLQSLISWAIAGLTQNAFQDSAVRYSLTIVAVLICLGVYSVNVKSVTNAPGT